MNAVKAVAQFTILNDGEKVLAGEEFDCTDQGLLDCGAAVLTSQLDDVDGSEGSGVGSTGGTDADPTLEEQVTALLTQWLKDDPEQADETKWTKAGGPKNKSVDNALGVDVTNDLIGPIWEDLKPKGD